jgi:hypothetical protein
LHSEATVHQPPYFAAGYVAKQEKQRHDRNAGVTTSLYGSEISPNERGNTDRKKSNRDHDTERAKNRRENQCRHTCGSDE